MDRSIKNTATLFELAVERRMARAMARSMARCMELGASSMDLPIYQPRCTMVS
jgi:hypothetical protein